MQKAQQNFKVQFSITILSVVLFVIKIVAYYYTHSLAILSDALESIVNIVAGFIGLFALYVAAKPKDQDHPYGHGKAEFISAAIEGTLIVAAGLLIIYQTIETFFIPAHVQQLDTGLWLIAITAVINYIAGLICVVIGIKNNSLALISSGKHLQIDTYSTVAIILGLLLMLLTNYLWIDKVFAFLLSIIILYNGYKIIRASLAGIMDEADTALLEKMVQILNANKKENWIDLHNLRVIKYGNLLHVDCHLTLPWFLNIHEAHKEIDDLTKLINSNFGDSVEFFVHTDGCLDFSCGICNKQDCNQRKRPFNNTVEWTLKNVLSNQKHNSVT